MKSTNNSKLKILLLCVVAFALSLIAAFSTMSFTVKADDTPAPVKASDYFSGASSVEFSQNNLVANVKNGNVLKVENKLAVKKLGLGIKLGANIESVTVIYSGVSEYAIGVDKDGNGKFTTAVSSELVIKKDGNLEFNGNTAQITPATEYAVVFNSENEVKIGDSTVISSKTAKNHDQKTYGDVKIIDLSFKFNVTGDNAETFTISYLSTDNDNANYKQTFELENNQIKTKVDPIVVFPSDKFAQKDGKISVEKDHKYEDIILTSYSLLGDNKAEVTLVPKKTDDSEISEGFVFDKAKKVMLFKSTDVAKIDCKVGNNVVNTFEVNVTDKTDDEAPKYKDASDVAVQSLIDDFTKAFQAKLVKEGSVYGTANAEYVALGSSEYLNLPTMEDLVSDGTTAYSALTYTVYYRTPTTSSSSSSKLSIPLTGAGKYSFYVAFSDTYGNSMDTEDFYTIAEKDSNDVNADGIYKDYIFEFEILDNATLDVTAAKAQGNGYVGVKYTAAKFSVVASSYNEKYTLLYSATKDSTKWIEIPKASTFNDKEYNKEGFTYDDIKAIGYNGTLSFTPDRAGYYKITCRVESDTTGRFAEGTTSIIEIQNEPKIVKPASKWLQNNVWSVVFLSVGTLCLIGIVVLLFVKPKEKVEDDE